MIFAKETGYVLLCRIISWHRVVVLRLGYMLAADGVDVFQKDFMRWSNVLVHTSPQL